MCREGLVGPRDFPCAHSFPVKEEKPHLWLEKGQGELNLTQKEAPRGLFTLLSC